MALCLDFMTLYYKMRSVRLSVINLAVLSAARRGSSWACSL